MCAMPEPNSQLNSQQTHQPTEAAPGIWRVGLPWTQVYLLTDGRDFSLVDSGTHWDRRAILAAIEALGLDPARCRQVLLTHAHPDHAGNAAFFAARFGAKLHLHAAERRFLATRRTYMRRLVGVQSVTFALGEVVWPVRRRRVDVTLRDGQTVVTPAGNWRVVATPGHTPGHVSYFREDDGILLSGDALLTVIPFRLVDGLALPPPIFNWDTAQAHRSVIRLAALAPRLLLPGHGRPWNDAAARIAEFVGKV
jgi:glyoxylase-like metal-dependent hydrolase (beta-lactamase superfamily II)